MNSTIIFRSSKSKNIILFLLSIAFVLAGASESSYFVIIFFGIGALVFLADLFPNSSYLKLNKEGFEFRNLFRTTFVLWSEVNNFSVISVSYEKVVGWNYLKGNKIDPKKFRKLISGFDCALPSNYGVEVENLVNIMNEYKLKNA